jgi:hypothetical protein
VPPVQQGSPGAPHCAHRPSLLALVVEHTAPPMQRLAEPLAGQQGSPRPPQPAHVPLRQSKPAAQVLPQHGWLAAPQPLHVPPLHVPPVLPHAVPSATQDPL